MPGSGVAGAAEPCAPALARGHRVTGPASAALLLLLAAAGRGLRASPCTGAGGHPAPARASGSPIATVAAFALDATVCFLLSLGLGLGPASILLAPALVTAVALLLARALRVGIVAHLASDLGRGARAARRHRLALAAIAAVAAGRLRPPLLAGHVPGRGRRPGHRLLDPRLGPAPDHRVVLLHRPELPAPEPDHERHPALLPVPPRLHLGDADAPRARRRPGALAAPGDPGGGPGAAGGQPRRAAGGAPVGRRAGRADLLPGRRARLRRRPARRLHRRGVQLRPVQRGLRDHQPGRRRRHHRRAPSAPFPAWSPTSPPASTA